MSVASIATIHLGASSFEVSICSLDGTLLYRNFTHCPIALRNSQTYPQLLNDIALGVDDAWLNGDACILVVTTPVPINVDRGFVGLAPAMPAMQDRPLRDDVSRIIMTKTGKEIPIYVENDAKAAALRSLHFGTAQGQSNYVHIRVSTGIGGGIVIDGSPYRGAQALAGEVGHITLQPFGMRCGCGNKGCAETVVGGGALLKAISRVAAKKTYAHFMDAIQAAESGDLAVVAELEIMGMYLGLVIASTVNVLNPGMVSLSGAMFDRKGILFARAKDEFDRRVCVGLECPLTLDRFIDDAHAKSGLSVYMHQTSQPRAI